MTKKRTNSVPEKLKDEINQKANQIIEAKFKPYIFERDKGMKEHGFNYVVDIYTKWWHNYFYFYCKYHCPSPRAICEFFDDPFTRMEYLSNERFDLSYMRHTNQWWKVYTGLTLEEVWQTIEEEIIFWP